MESAAEVVAGSLSKVAGAPTRTILNALRQRGRLTRPQLFEITSRELIPSKSRLRDHLQTLVAQKRIKVRTNNSWKEDRRQLQLLGDRNRRRNERRNCFARFLLL